MANCGILLNDGTSFLQINSGDFFLLNDNSCDTEPDGGGSPPPTPTVGWVPLKTKWKPSKSVNREVKELLEGLKAKAAELSAPKKAKVQEAVKEVREAIYPTSEIAEDDAQQLIDLMRTALAATSISSMLDWTRQLETLAIAIKAQDEEDEEELLLLLH